MDNLTRCENCNESYAPSRYWQKYCSEACRWTAFKARHPNYKPGTPVDENVQDNALSKQQDGNEG